MAINIAGAAAAYSRQASVVGASPMEARSKDPAQSFADLLGDAVAGAIDAGRQGEKLSTEAIAGKADLQEVVIAVTNAEVTLQTALAIRDRVVQAYQDILRMPI